MDRPPRRRTARTRPVWEGIYTFPLRFSNLGPLLGVTFTLAFLTLLGCGFRCVYLAITPKELEGLKGLVGANPILLRGAFHVYIALVVLSFFACLYPAAIFLRIVQETAWGNDEIRWSREDWYEWITDFLYVLWVAGSAAALAGLVMLGVDRVVAVSRTLWWSGTVFVALFLFPLVLFSTMAGGSVWVVVYPPMFARLFRRPGLLAGLYVNALLFYMPCALLGYLAVVQLYAWLVPAVGLVWATYWICYARLLGRVAWVLVHGDRSEGRKRRRLSAREADEG